MGETCTVRELFEECLNSLDDSMDNEQAIKVLKAYGTRIDGYIEEYIKGRSSPGKYSREIHGELGELAGYLMAGLPASIKDGTIDFLWDGDVKKAFKTFAEDNISEETWSHSMRFPVY